MLNFIFLLDNVHGFGLHGLHHVNPIHPCILASLEGQPSQRRKPPGLQCLDKSFCHNTFHSTSSTTTVKIKISGESLQKEFQIMIMKKYFGKNNKIKFVFYVLFFLLIFKNA